MTKRDYYCIFRAPKKEANNPILLEIIEVTPAQFDLTANFFEGFSPAPKQNGLILRLHAGSLRIVNAAKKALTKA